MSLRARRRASVRAVTAVAAAVAALAGAIPAAAGAQLAVLRTTTAAPLDMQPGRRFPSPAFVGDLARGFGSTDGARAWNATLRGLVQIRTRGGRLALVGELANEMTANPYNAGGLNPRGTAWEEDVRLVGRLPYVDVQLGTFFRCRHEVDGATPIDERPNVPATPVTARVVMNKGIELGAASRELTFGRRLRARVAGSVDRFTAREDWRVPVTTTGPSWAQATGRATGTVRLSVVASRWAEPYVRAWGSTTAFRAADGAPARHGRGTRVETGVRFGNTGGRFDLFAVREALFDDLSHANPAPSRVVGFGVRAASAAFF